MTVDKEDRARVADAIEKYLRCEIDNFALDNILFTAKDRAAREISMQLWFFYSDTRRHKNEGNHTLSEASKAVLRRWIQFLRSEHEWPIDEPNSRTRWYSGTRWRGVLAPVGCLLALILVPVALFEIVVLRHPRPRFAKNEYWPFQSLAEWEQFSLSTLREQPGADAAGKPAG